MIPKYLFHKIFGGNTHPDHAEVRAALGQISKEGLIPLVAREWANLVPEQIRHLPIVWLAEKVGSSRGVWLWINTSELDESYLFKLDLDDVEWWVYQGNIPNTSIERIEDTMVQEEITYEQSLETMNEEGLRTECVRLKNRLDVIQVQQLTQPVEFNDFDIDEAIEVMRQRMEDLVDCDSSFVITNILADVVNGLLNISREMAMQIKGYDMEITEKDRARLRKRYAKLVGTIGG